MTDAVDRKQHRVGAADEPGQQALTLLNAPVVIEKRGAGAFRGTAQAPDLRGAAADIEHCQAGLGLGVIFGVGGRQRRFQHVDLAPQGGLALFCRHSRDLLRGKTGARFSKLLLNPLAMALGAGKAGAQLDRRAIVGSGRRRRRLNNRAFLQRFNRAQGMVASSKRFAEPFLVEPQLAFQFLLFGLELAQATDIGAIGRADQV